MFCPTCGKEMPENGVCVCQQAAPPPVQPQQPYQQPYPQQKADNSKIYKILSYVGILWLIGLFVTPEKNDPKVKFHVGQGMIASIVYVALLIINAILTAILGSIFTVQSFGYWGVGSYAMPSPFVGVLSLILSLAIWALVIIWFVVGLMNVLNDREKPLPIVGKFAFYK